ncbi:MAG: ATP-binding protein [Chlamydiota bacterium]
MIVPKKIKKMENFVGRHAEWKRLITLGKSQESSILIVYGRRRVGKTELLEQVYADRNILKFEGIRGKSQEAQMAHVLWQLSEYVQNSLIAKLKVTSWIEVFKLIHDSLTEGAWTVYFEEIQWLADYKDAFISELKFAWDNYFRYRQQCLVILCGSSPSFIVNQVIFSKSLYNRSQSELHLREFGLAETREFLSNRSHREVMDAYLTVGGIPEYLKWCKTSSSVFSSICINTFTPDSFFSTEFDRVFVSSLAENKHYKKIIEFLGCVRFASREEILHYLKTSSSGYISEILKDIELCGFIEKYTPYNLNEESTLSRYCISDQYLQFYYKFIKPEITEIKRGTYQDNPTLAIKMDSYQKWLGYAFERFCRHRHLLIAKILGFHGIHYRAGAFFTKKTQTTTPGFQFDLVFDRDDQVITLCEMKYSQGKIGPSIIEEFERKLELFPNLKRKTIQKVLVTTEGASDSLLTRHYFDQIITLDSLFAADS